LEQADFWLRPGKQSIDGLNAGRNGRGKSGATLRRWNDLPSPLTLHRAMNAFEATASSQRMALQNRFHALWHGNRAGILLLEEVTCDQNLP